MSYRPSSRVLWQPVANEGVLLDLAQEAYFGLNPVGMRVWTLLSEGHDLAAVVSCLLQDYDVSREQLQTDVAVLLEQLLAAGLIEPAPPVT